MAQIKLIEGRQTNVLVTSDRTIIGSRDVLRNWSCDRCTTAQDLCSSACNRKPAITGAIILNMLEDLPRLILIVETTHYR